MILYKILHRIIRLYQLIYHSSVKFPSIDCHDDDDDPSSVYSQGLILERWKGHHCKVAGPQDTLHYARSLARFVSSSG